jgi:GTP-binding protein
MTKPAGHPPVKTPATPPQPPLAAKTAMGWMHTARFLTTAAQLHHLPR